MKYRRTYVLILECQMKSKQPYGCKVSVGHFTTVKSLWQLVDRLDTAPLSAKFPPYRELSRRLNACEIVEVDFDNFRITAMMTQTAGGFEGMLNCSSIPLRDPAAMFF